MKAIILAAGEGTRLRPFTDTIPKPLLPVREIPLLIRTMQSLPETISEVFIVIKEKHKDIFIETCARYPIETPYTFLFQDEVAKGTFFAISTALPYLMFDEYILVLNGDDLYTKATLMRLLANNFPAYLLQHKKLSPRYRTCDIDEKTKIITTFRKQTDKEIDTIEVPCFTGASVLPVELFTKEPVYQGGEASAPASLFKYYSDVSYELCSDWVQINTVEELAEAQKEF
jgi:NDP-sugar pyrophosphorylase family protein